MFKAATRCPVARSWRRSPFPRPSKTKSVSVRFSATSWVPFTLTYNKTPAADASIKSRLEVRQLNHHICVLCFYTRINHNMFAIFSPEIYEPCQSKKAVWTLKMFRNVHYSLNQTEQIKTKCCTNRYIDRVPLGGKSFKLDTQLDTFY